MFTHTIDKKYKLNIIIDDNIISFDFCDKNYYDIYTLELNEEFIKTVFNLVMEILKKFIFLLK